MPVMHSLTHCPHAIFIIAMKRRRKERQKELRRSRSRYVAYYYMQSFNLSPSRHSLRKQLHMSIYVQVRRFMYAGTGRSYYYYSQVSSALLPGTDSRRVAHTPWSSHLFTRRSDSLNLVFLCRWQSFRISLFFLSFILLFVKLALQQSAWREIPNEITNFASVYYNYGHGSSINILAQLAERFPKRRR